MIKKVLLFSLLTFFVQGGCRNESQQPKPKETTQTQTTAENRNDGNQNMSDSSSNKKPNPQSAFYETLNTVLSKRGMSANTVCDGDDVVARRILEEYGAMFLANEVVLVPPVCMFTSEQAVLRFQNQAGPKATNIGGIKIELQSAALNDLLAARAEAQQQGLDITPRGGEAARRNFADTVRLWDSRVKPALAYWQSKGKISSQDAARIRSLPMRDQVREVLELEKQGIYFSTDFSKSILYSVAAPGTSQHLSMLAFDAKEFGNKRVREILARHGWFQTVKSDAPHFTYLGVKESELPSLGLRSVKVGEQVFWVPNVN